MDAIAKINDHLKVQNKKLEASGQKNPLLYKYYLQQDPDRTGNLEVTVHPYSALKEDEEKGPIVVGNGVLVHSKAKTGRYIVQAMSEMLKNIDSATKETQAKL